MDTCLSCGCGFGIYHCVAWRVSKLEENIIRFQFSEPVRRGNLTICPSCDAMEKKRGYCHSRDSFLVWDGEKFKGIRLGGKQFIELRSKETAEERREYLLKLLKEKEVRKEQDFYEPENAGTVIAFKPEAEEGAPEARRESRYELYLRSL